MLMKNYLLKCDKWFSSKQTIFSNGHKAGSFLPGLYASASKVILEENEFILRRKNAFSNNLSVYSDHRLLAEVKCSPFKNESIITTSDRDKYVFKSNIWNNSYQLSGEEGLLGECHQRMISTTFSFDDKVKDLLVAVAIGKSYSNYETMIYIACFVPIIVMLIIH
jgi:hypothetical protein